MSDIRILTLDDLAQYKALLETGDHAFNWDKIYLTHITEENLNLLLSPDMTYTYIFGMFDQNELVAAATYYQIQFVGREHKANFEDLFVKENNHDYSKALIRHILQYAEDHQIEKVMTSIISNNISDKIMYSSIGFETLGYEEDAYKINDEYQDVHWLIYHTKRAKQKND